MRRDAVRKQIRPRSLPQKIDNLFAATGETAARTAERFAERASNDVDLAHHAAVFVGAASAFTEKASRMRVIDHGERGVFLCKIDNRSELRDRSVHRKTAIGRD